MDFVGTGNKITDADIAAVAVVIDVPEAALRAVLAVETGGSGFDKSNRPKALFERHFFYRHLIGDDDKLEKAVNAGLAYPKWGEKPYPKTSDGVYAEIAQAVEIDEEAALLSTSWGLGQIMGENYRLAQCKTVQEMVEEAKQGEANQFRHMTAYIKSTGLVDELQRLDWAGFARHYNGPAYIKNAYDTKLADAYARFA